MRVGVHPLGLFGLKIKACMNMLCPSRFGRFNNGIWLTILWFISTSLSHLCLPMDSPNKQLSNPG